MDIVCSFLTGLVSFSYIGFSAKKYLDYKKFERLGYVDDFHLVEGKVTTANSSGLTSNGLVSIVQEYKGHPTENLLIKNLSVKIGKEKIGTYFIPIQSGKTTMLIPQSYTYTDWETLHNKTTFGTNLFLDHVKLRIGTVTPFFTNNYNIKETDSHKLLNLYNTLNKHNVEFKNGDKIKVVEEYIQHSENVSVFGKYITNEEIDVKYIGNKNQLIAAVRKNICKLKYSYIAIASCVLVGSIGYAVMNYENEKLNKKNHYGEYNKYNKY